MTDKREKKVCCVDCSYFKSQFIGFVNTEHIEGERHSMHSYSGDASQEEIEKIKKEHEIPHHEILPPSNYCNTTVKMCQHPDCSNWHNTVLMGMPYKMEQRHKGQAQLNSDGECKRYKRKWWKIR